MKNAYKDFGTALKAQIPGLLGFKKNMVMPKGQKHILKGNKNKIPVLRKTEPL